MSRRKKLGQIFLKNPKIVQKIIETIKPKKGELIIEIGPGKGVLTEPLLKSQAKVIAVEKDPVFCQFLKEKFFSYKNLFLINQDIREFLKSQEFEKLIKNRNYKIAGNIPYYLTSYLLRIIMESKKKPDLIVLMVQKEVALRILAKPPKMNLLAVLTQFYFHPQIIQIVKKGNFSPIPKVDSAIIKLEPYYNEFNTNPDFEKAFLKLVKNGFKQQRKMLINNLKNIFSQYKIKNILLKYQLKNNLRPSYLSVKEWIKLSQEIS